MDKRRSSWVLLATLWFALPQPDAWADAGGFLFPSPRPGANLAATQPGASQAGSSWRPTLSRRTLLGLALAGGGGYFVKKGFDYHREADLLYDRYLDALDPAEISLLYQRTNKRDLKSKLSWALGAAMAAGGLRMTFGRYLAALHLELAPPVAGAYSRTGDLGTHLKLSRSF